jgi:hypothetical protein
MAPRLAFQVPDRLPDTIGIDLANILKSLKQFGVRVSRFADRHIPEQMRL